MRWNHTKHCQTQTYDSGSEDNIQHQWFFLKAFTWMPSLEHYHQKSQLHHHVSPLPQSKLVSSINYLVLCPLYLSQRKNMTACRPQWNDCLMNRGSPSPWTLLPVSVIEKIIRPPQSPGRTTDVNPNWVREHTMGHNSDTKQGSCLKTRSVNISNDEQVQTVIILQG